MEEVFLRGVRWKGTLGDKKNMCVRASDGLTESIDYYLST